MNPETSTTTPAGAAPAATPAPAQPAAVPATPATAAAGAPAAPEAPASQLLQQIEALLAPKDAATEEAKSYTPQELEAFAAEKVAAAQAEWEAKAAPKAPEGEKASSLDEEVKALKAQVLAGSLKAAAVEDLSAAGYPVALAELLPYDSKENMEKGLRLLKDNYANSLAESFRTMVKGKTPLGLGAGKAPAGTPVTAAERAKAMNAHRIVGKQ